MATGKPGANLNDAVEEGLRLEGRLFVECQRDARAVDLEEQALRRYREAPPNASVEL